MKIDHVELLLILQRWREEHAEKLAPAFYKVLGSLQRSKNGILSDRGQ
jgi:hypothetical protein